RARRARPAGFRQGGDHARRAGGRALRRAARARGRRAGRAGAHARVSLAGAPPARALQRHRHGAEPRGHDPAGRRRGARGRPAFRRHAGRGYAVPGAVQHSRHRRLDGPVRGHARAALPGRLAGRRPRPAEGAGPAAPGARGGACGPRGAVAPLACVCCHAVVEFPARRRRLTVYYRYLHTPIGELLLAGDEDALRVVAFPKGKRRREPEPGWIWSEKPLPFVAACEQLEAYFAGRLKTFDLPLAPRGAPFQLAVLDELRQIPYGRTASYGEIAGGGGGRKAVGAVGAASGGDPVPILIPCRRVIGASGGLRGFGGGLPVREALLRLEMEHRAFPHVLP